MKLLADTNASKCLNDLKLILQYCLFYVVLNNAFFGKEEILNFPITFFFFFWF